MTNNEQKKKVLVVDNDAYMRILCKEVLVFAGFEVHQATNTEEAWQLLKHERFDIVVSDVNTSSLMGLHLYAYAMIDYPYLKDRFLFIAYKKDMDELHGAFDRVGGVIVKKPLKVIEFMSAVESIMNPQAERSFKQSA